MSVETIHCEYGAYPHSATLRFERGLCDVCKQDKGIVVIDTSQGEYAELHICRECVASRFEAFEAEH